MQELELHVNTENEKLLIGADYITLDDESTSTFETDDIAEFINYVKDDGSDIVIYYSINAVEAYRDTGIYKHTKPLAVYMIVYSDVLDIARGINRQKINLETAQTTLRRLTKYLDKKGLALKDQLENLKIRKILNVDVKKDNQGNFLYSVEQSAGKNDYIFPESIDVSVPLFNFNDVKINITLDFFFRHKVLDAEVSVSVTFENIELFDNIKREIRKFLKKQLSSFKKVYYGECVITRQDNSWQYKENKLEK